MVHNDMDDARVLAGFVPIFWLFVGIGTVLFFYSLRYAKRYATTAAFVLTPFLCFSLVFDNAMMATTGIDRRRTSTHAMVVCHAGVAPLLVLVCYEVAFLVHRHKAVNFCGTAFERARRGATAGAAASLATRRLRLSTCVRCSVWLAASGLLGLNLLVAYSWTSNNTLTSASFYDVLHEHTRLGVCASVPALALVALALYLGLRLWNYGTHYSYMVHATWCNPWVWMLGGAVALLIGYSMPSPLYALSSNAGELFMVATIVRTFREVHHDMQQGLQLGDFIDPEGAARRQRPRLQRLSLSKSTSLSKVADEQPQGYMAASTPTGSDRPMAFANRLHRDERDRGDDPSASVAVVAVVQASSRADEVEHRPRTPKGVH